MTIGEFKDSLSGCNNSDNVSIILYESPDIQRSYDVKYLKVCDGNLAIEIFDNMEDLKVRNDYPQDHISEIKPTVKGFEPLINALDDDYYVLVHRFKNVYVNSFYMIPSISFNMNNELYIEIFESPEIHDYVEKHRGKVPKQ